MNIIWIVLFTCGKSIGCLSGGTIHFPGMIQFTIEIFGVLLLFPSYKIFILVILALLKWWGYYCFIVSLLSQVASSILWFLHKTLTRGILLFLNYLISITKIFIGFLNYFISLAKIFIGASSYDRSSCISTNSTIRIWEEFDLYLLSMEIKKTLCILSSFDGKGSLYFTRPT